MRIGGITAVGDIGGDIVHDATDLTISGETQGDILFFNGTNWIRLASVAAGEVLTAQGVSSNPAYASIPLPDDFNISGQTTGDILYFDGANWVRLAAATSGDVLTANGAGVAPSYQTPGGGGGTSLVSVTSGSGANTGDITISPSNRYLVVWSCNSGAASQIRFRVNSLTASNYSYGASKKANDAVDAETYFGSGAINYIAMADQGDTLDGTNGILRGHFYIDTLLNSGTLPHSIYIWGETMYRDNANDFWHWRFSGAYRASITVANFEIDFNGVGTAHAVYLYQLANS